MYTYLAGKHLWHLWNHMGKAADKILSTNWHVQDVKKDNLRKRQQRTAAKWLMVVVLGHILEYLLFILFFWAFQNVLNGYDACIRRALYLNKETRWAPETGRSLWSLPWGGRHPLGPGETCRDSPGRAQRYVPAATSAQCVGGSSPGQRSFQTEGDKTSQAGTSQFQPERSAKPGLLASSTSLGWSPCLQPVGPNLPLLVVPSSASGDALGSPQLVVWPWHRHQHALSS